MSDRNKEMKLIGTKNCEEVTAGSEFGKNNNNMDPFCRTVITTDGAIIICAKMIQEHKAQFSILYLT